MKFFVRAVVTGFGLSLGAAIYKKVAKRFGFDDDAKDSAKDVTARDGAADPSLQAKFS